MTATLDIDTSFEPQDQLDEYSAARLVRSLRLGDPQTEGPLCILPIFSDPQDGSGDDAATFEYVTLRQALAEGHAEVTEVSEGGSVGELRFVNKGDACVLALDGEQLVGAKQDRVLATPVLVDRHSTLTLPASCTERGRWAYASRRFADTDFMAERQIRLSMKRSILASMQAGGGVHADQRAVWAEVEMLGRKHKTTSRTQAMRDVYAAKRADLDLVLAAFPCCEGQVGVLVLDGSRVVGLDFVSQARQYAHVHARLLRSYVLEALVGGGEPGDTAVADAFLERVASLQGEPFKSVGLGSDVRYAGEGIVGHALVHDGHVVHASFFETAGGGSTDDARHDDRSGQHVSENLRRRFWADPHRGDLRSAVDAGGSRDPFDEQVSGQGGLFGGSAQAPSRNSRAHLLASYVSTLPLTFTDFEPYLHMGGLLVDVTLQRGVSYSGVVQPRVRRIMREHPDPTTSAFAALLAISDPYLLLEFGNRAVISTLLTLTQLLVDEGVVDPPAFLEYLDRPEARERVLAIRGIGEKTYEYARFLCGAEDAVAVDRHLHRILADAGVRVSSFTDAVLVYRQAANLLGVTPAALEWAAFRWASAAARTRR